MGRIPPRQARTDYKAVENLVHRADFDAGLGSIRSALRRCLSDLLGKDDWEIIRKLGVYNITTRIKMPDRILKKFGRLQIRGARPINFWKRIPDLVAGRVIVLDPCDVFEVAEDLRRKLKSPFFAPPCGSWHANRIRLGRLTSYDIPHSCRRHYKIDRESDGYSSIHFVRCFRAAFFERACIRDEQRELEKLKALLQLNELDQWLVEIQVRTILEDAFEEVSHWIYEDDDLYADPQISRHLEILAIQLHGASAHVTSIRQLAKTRKKELRKGKRKS